MGFWRNAFIASWLVALSGSATAAEQQQRRPQYHRPSPERLAEAERAVARFNSPTLTHFASDEEFRQYLVAVLSADRARHGWWAMAPRIQFAALQDPSIQSDAAEPICSSTDPECLPLLESNIVVTGSRITPSNPSITNNQMRNVEEGDIVKQIDHYLLVLQDGRIFVIDIRAGRGRRLALTDRADVYRDPREDMWYDEMLVFGDRVLITGYSYDDEATELSVFRLKPDGRLTREGVFYISSNDYYSSSNYATRLIGDSLVIYTPFEIFDMAESSFSWPVVRRWTEGDKRDFRRRGRPLFDATQIYRPARSDEDPTVHSVSVCPLGEVGPGGDLECRTTAFVGPNSAQWYVTESDAFLWTTSRSDYSYESQACDAPRSFESNADRALVYRVPIDGGIPGLVGARGVPPDQFSLDSREGRFRALLKDRPIYCRDETEPEAVLSYLDFSLSEFRSTVRELEAVAYVPLPGVGSHYIANRFTDRFLVYGSLGRYRRGLAERAMPPVYAVQVGRPRDVRSLDVRHTVLRAEQAGNDIVLTGYRDTSGLLVTLIDLDGRARIASTAMLESRFESEGRSHAFNSQIAENGSGVMGLPTTRGEGRSARASWRSRASDLSYLTVNARGELRPIGELEHRIDYGDGETDEDGVKGYACEVSCVDWYGNSRPIFTDNRVFALTGVELIEGRILGDEILEVQRLNIARPVTSRLASGKTN